MLKCLSSYPNCRRCGFNCIFLKERRMDINPGKQCELCEHCYRTDVIQYLDKGTEEPVPVPYGWTYACALNVPPEEEVDTRFKFLTAKPVELKDRLTIEKSTKLVTLGTELGDKVKCDNYKPFELK